MAATIAMVVICFHSFSQRSLTQPGWGVFTLNICCDLLSFFFSTIFDTTAHAAGNNYTTLWFAFILFLNDLWHNSIMSITNCFIVVICFHSFSQRSLTQQGRIIARKDSSCDLLSFFFSTIFDTTKYLHCVGLQQLWFAFILFLNDLWHNHLHTLGNYWPVVICFHSFSQRSLTQSRRNFEQTNTSCDLLSFFFSTIFDTT